MIRNQSPLPNAARRLVTGTLTVSLICLAGAARAETDQEVMEIRGELMSVWPAADLRERGFDVPDIPRDQNAAWVYVDAWNTYSDLPDDLADAFDYALAKAWPDGQPRFRKWLTGKENRAAIKLAHQAARMERCQMPYFGDPDGSVISVLLPSLRHHRLVAKLVVVDGRRLAAQKDYRGAMRSYVTGMRIGHHASQGFTIIEGLVGVACWSLGDRAVRDMVLRHDIPKDDLAAIFDEWRKLKACTPTMERGFEGERLFGPSIVDELVSSPTCLIRNVNGWANFEALAGPVRPKSGWGRLEARVGRVFLPDRTIKRHMAAYYDAWVESARVPYYDERVQNFDEEEQITSIPRWDVLSRALLPSLSRARVLGAHCRTDTRATTLALALRLHARQNRGKYPAGLADLCVEVDADDLIDPFAGGEFGYARTSGAWTLYSVGPDGNDDGGRPGDRWDSEGSDMVYVFPPEPLEPFDADEE